MRQHQQHAPFPLCDSVGRGHSQRLQPLKLVRIHLRYRALRTEEESIVKEREWQHVTTRARFHSPIKRMVTHPASIGQIMGWLPAPA
ncbi:hypothetical protein PIB30_062279 [Stylosanthes scabra]|uniref:Uncharacterized protein n=1 Tax=Stylosanthes scabra TaxID=79078 RepID=A0ABU6SMA3_9FABA|nr:hypothetical protein [Stylosanthes scabra]